MRDTTTVVGPLPTPDPERPRARRVSLSPLKRFSRAHLALASREGVRSEARMALNAGLEALATQLGHPLSAQTRLVDGTLQPLQHLGTGSLYVTVELSTASTLALVELEGPLVSHLLHVAAGSDLRAVAATSLTRIESAALGWLALSVIAGLRKETGFEARFGPRLVSLTLDRGEALRSINATTRHLALEIALTGEHPLGIARVLVPAKMIQLAVQSSPESEPPPAQPAILDATLTFQTRFGQAQLQRADVGELAPGDVIVFAGSRLVDGRLLGPARFLTRTFELSGELGADGFTVTRVQPPPQETPMSVNVDVEVELTTIQLPVRQLGTIAPGAVLPLHINAAQTVTLRIDGKAVALAELVEVEGEIGARVTAMLDGAP